MGKLILVLSVLAVFLIAESSCGRSDLNVPTYRPPPTRPPTFIFRSRRGADDEPLSLWKGENVDRAPSTADHPFLPSVIDDIKLDPYRRTARSLSSPRASRGGGSRSSSSWDTGPTHLGYNLCNARSLNLPGYQFPLSRMPPFNPRPRNPIYARN